MSNRNSESVVNILDIVRDGDIEHDPYGTVVTALFDIAAYTYALHGETLPDYYPAPTMVANSGWSQLTDQTDEEMLNALIVNDILFGIDGLRDAYAILSRFADILTANGRSY